MATCVPALLAVAGGAVAQGDAELPAGDDTDGKAARYLTEVDSAAGRCLAAGRNSAVCQHLSRLLSSMFFADYLDECGALGYWRDEFVVANSAALQGRQEGQEGTAQGTAVVDPLSRLDTIDGACADALMRERANSVLMAVDESEPPPVRTGLFSQSTSINDGGEPRVLHIGRQESQQIIRQQGRRDPARESRRAYAQMQRTIKARQRRAELRKAQGNASQP